MLVEAVVVLLVPLAVVSGPNRFFLACFRASLEPGWSRVADRAVARTVSPFLVLDCAGCGGLHAVVVASVLLLLLASVSVPEKIFPGLL